VSSNDRRKKQKKRKPYEKPKATQLTEEEGKARLRRLIEQGDDQAEEMFRIISRKEAEAKPEDDDLNGKKKSA
jgi:hypothetical protein